MTREEIKNITIEAIKQLPLYNTIMDKIKSRAELGYNYVYLDGDFMETAIKNSEAIDFHKIYIYLEDEGYTIRATNAANSWSVAWSLK